MGSLTLYCQMNPSLALLFLVLASVQTKTPPGPAPGRLVDVFGHKMHIQCEGPPGPKPTVVIEAGGGDFSRSWSAIQRTLAPTVRTCAYDRAGLGWSEPGPAPRTMRQEVFELHVLLKKANVKGPIVLLGHSLGGLAVRVYTELYPREVAGIVLVDSTHEDSTLFNMPANRWMMLREQATGRTVPQPRKTGPPSTGYKAEDDYLSEEFRLLFEHRRAHPSPLGDRPLIVLAAGHRPPPPGMTEESYKDLRKVKEEQAADLAKLSRNSKFIRDPESTHQMQGDNPDLIARSVLEVVEAVRRRGKRN